MSDNYLYSVLDTFKENCYIVDLSIVLPLHFDKLLKVQAKIDTGCMKTCISFKQFLSRKNQKDTSFKLKAISANLPASISFGVNDSLEYIETQKVLYHNRDYMNCTAISFIHPIKSIYLGEYEVPVDGIKISYDRPRSILIGMDILRNFDMHTGVSKVNGENVLIGCLRDNITPEYLTALEEHFGYTLKERIIAELVRDGFLIPKHKI